MKPYTKYHGNDLEDKVLAENFKLPAKGVFVDIGAGPDGIQGSNSYHFEKNGWKVVCADADPRNAEALRRNRKCVYSVAVGTKEGKLTLYTNPKDPDVSSLKDSYEGNTTNVNVEGMKLETILTKEGIGEIDVLSIDTEGTELDVWMSFDCKAHRPKIVIIEAVSQGVLAGDVSSFLETLGYVWKATIGPNYFYVWEERNPHRIVYGSSYDRGLEHLLKMWPKIREAVPDAELRIFYGWQTFDAILKNNPASQEWKARMVQLMRQDGITELGRISHYAVRREFETAGVWAYPTHFGEISCITAMKAQAYGAVPVVINYAALKETVQHGIKVEGDIYDQETKDEYCKELIALLNDEKRQESIRNEMIPWAHEQFGWDKVAKQWDSVFRTPNLDKDLAQKVYDLMEDNQPLKAWELVKDTDSPLKSRVWLRVRHAFEPETYKEYYSQDLIENPLDDEISFKVDGVFPRFAWVVPKILALNPKTLLDLGCADGYLCLTVASKSKTHCKGVNLYQPSVAIANRRSGRRKLNATFDTGDLFDVTEKADCVVMMEVLEHLPDPQKGVDHAMSLLNDGGRAYFSTPRTDHVGVEMHKNEPNKGHWDDGKPSGHLRLFTEEEFKNLFKNYKILDYYLDAERCMCVEVGK